MLLGKMFRGVHVDLLALESVCVHPEAHGI
jgi:hypothetical protein